ncbi:protein kinase domain-containing protein [Penicillium malachiteum]|nr:protein kinase domain-containing protein [Penicillium malachiteum]
MTPSALFKDVDYAGMGGIARVYKISPDVVVKVAQDEDSQKEQIGFELSTYKRLAQQKACSFIVHSIYYTDYAIFFPYMRGGDIAMRVRKNCTMKSYDPWIIGKVNILEPLRLRLKWMHDLVQGVAFLESLNLSQGDLQPANILLDHHDRLKIADYDCAADFGTPYISCLEPYGRALGKMDPDFGKTEWEAGMLGPRTEQFALGSIFYYFNYGMDPYRDQYLTSNPKERHYQLRDLFQAMEFPALNGDPDLDDITHKCWHNHYPIEVKALIDRKWHEEHHIRGRLEVGSAEDKDTQQLDADFFDDRQISSSSAEEISTQKLLCQQLMDAGLFDYLSVTFAPKPYPS